MWIGESSDYTFKLVGTDTGIMDIDVYDVDLTTGRANGEEKEFKNIALTSTPATGGTQTGNSTSRSTRNSSSQSAIAATGDASYTFAWAILAGISLLCGSGLMVYKCNKRRKS